MDYSASEESFEKNTIRKFEIARNVLKACVSEANMLKHLNVITLPNKRTAEYTQCSKRILNIAVLNMKSEKNVANQKINEKLKKIDFTEYEKYRDIYVNSYLNERKIPDNNTFSKANNSLDSLNNFGFTWTNVPNTNKSMIIERSELTRRRMDYLSKIIKYRNSGKMIIYVEEISVAFLPLYKREIYDFASLASSPSITVIASKEGKLFLAIYTSFKDSSINKAIVTALLKIDVMSVVVLAEKSHHEENIAAVPNASDSKQKMVEFLTLNDIPYNPDMHRAELYMLIQKSKNKCIKECYKFDAKLNAQGHVVLRRPPFGLKRLNFLNMFWSAVNSKIAEDKNIYTHYLRKIGPLIDNVVKTFNNGGWAKSEADLIAYEKRIYTEDLQVEEIIDRIQTMALDGQVDEEDLPTTNSHLENNSMDIVP